MVGVICRGWEPLWYKIKEIVETEPHLHNKRTNRCQRRKEDHVVKEMDRESYF